MTFGDGLRGEQVTGFANQNSSFYVYTDSKLEQKKTTYLSSLRFGVSRHPGTGRQGNAGCDSLCRTHSHPRSKSPNRYWIAPAPRGLSLAPIQRSSLCSTCSTRRSTSSGRPPKWG